MMAFWFMVVSTLPYMAPVGFAALGEIVGQQAGLINVGLEGIMLCGAFFALVGVTMVGGHLAIVAGLILGTLAGLGLALASAFFTVTMAADQVVVGTAINLFALGLTTSMYRNRYGASGQLISLPSLTRWHGLDWLIVTLFALIPATWFLLKRTGIGLAMRASGDFPESCEAAGYSVKKVRWFASAIGGLLGGLGGAYLVLGTTATFSENMTAGRGFLAIALVTFGRWKPTWVTLAAIFMGLLDAIQFQFQAAQVHISAYLLQALPYFGALVVLAISGSGKDAPRALAIPYDPTR